MGCGQKNNSGYEQRALEAERAAKVTESRAAIDKNFEGFDDEFFDSRAKDYETFAVPQLTSQYDNTKKNLTYSLSRAGLLGSSTQAAKTAALDKENAQQLRNVVDAGKSQANELRQTVEGQRANLYAQAEASADPGAATSLALRTAQAYERPTSFAPIGNFFKSFTETYLANNEAKQYAPTADPMYSWGGSTQRLVNG
jgi:hypothetical protein